MDTDRYGTLNTKFSPRQCTSVSDGLSFDAHPSTENLEWIPVLEAPVAFSAYHFKLAVEESLLHPERNSSLILRAEILSPDTQTEAPEVVKHISHYTPNSNLVRRLIPRQQNRDPSLDQDCTFLLANCDPEAALVVRSQTDDEHSPAPSTDEEQFPSHVVLTPRLGNGSTSLPWYHPPVRHLSFRFMSPNIPGDESLIRIEVVLDNPERDSHAVGDPTSRLYRTCLSLLETVYRYGKGKKEGYKKRVDHDTLVPRNEYQDLYLIMRDRFKGIADTWHEATDASKHVFEDISIATFLILLWKYTYPAPETPSVLDSERPWLSWGRPPHGFLDFGCGNGLLVHILIECGYDGLGVDVRARKSWAHYPEATRNNLHVYPFDPTSNDIHLLLDPASESQHLSESTDVSNGSSIARAMFPGPTKGRFIIGNHADELQPWVPVFAALTEAEYISIPCCAWEFDQRYQMKKRHKIQSAGATSADVQAFPRGDEEGIEGTLKEEEELERKLKHGEPNGVLGLYASYVLWLARLSHRCGYVIESEALRIPSTKNRALIGRRHILAADETDRKAALRRRMISIVEDVKKRGAFKPRVPEGKAGLGADGDELVAVKPDGRPRTQPDVIFRLKNMDGGVAPDEFRPSDLSWGNGNTTRYAGPRRVGQQRKSFMSLGGCD